MIGRVLFGILIALHCILLPGFVHYLKERPIVVKLGYIPHPQILKIASADQYLSVASTTIVKALFYYGTLVEKFQENVIVRPEYANLYRVMQTAIKLDPYNMDAYYFSQAAFTWELGRIEEVNHLLRTGMKYRTWDASLPFYLGFNHAYFLKDYKQAAEYMSLAAEISKNPLYTNLAARFFYESAQTNLGLLFLDGMIAGAKDDSVKQTYRMRKDALLAVTFIQKAMAEFKKHNQRDAVTIEELQKFGVLDDAPSDPYGGEFFIDESGAVRSTSKFAKPIDKESENSP